MLQSEVCFTEPSVSLKYQPESTGKHKLSPEWEKNHRNQRSKAIDSESKEKIVFSQENMIWFNSRTTNTLQLFSRDKIWQFSHLDEFLRKIILDSYWMITSIFLESVNSHFLYYHLQLLYWMILWNNDYAIMIRFHEVQILPFGSKHHERCDEVQYILVR